jgi:pseudaminic acid cytidylyltransferase
MDICLIPARSGSKRLKNKNIISFFGKPMISYSIKTAIKCNLFKKIIVSTDSNKIAKISKKYGAEIPFMRPKKISNDFASDYDVIEHFINYAKAKNLKIRFLCYLYPVNPLLKISTLKKCKKKIIVTKCKKIVTIGKYSHPVQRALIKDKLGNIFYKEKNNTNKRSQNLNTLYHDAAQCYWYDLRKIKNIRNVANQTKSIELKKFEFLDVDTSEDFNNLKKIFKLNLHK